MPEVNGRYVPEDHADAKGAEAEKVQEEEAKPVKKRATKRTTKGKRAETAMTEPTDEVETRG